MGNYVGLLSDGCVKLLEMLKAITTNAKAGRSLMSSAATAAIYMRYAGVDDEHIIVRLVLFDFGKT